MTFANQRHLEEMRDCAVAEYCLSITDNTFRMSVHCIRGGTGQCLPNSIGRVGVLAVESSISAGQVADSRRAAFAHHPPVGDARRAHYH